MKTWTNGWICPFRSPRRKRFEALERLNRFTTYISPCSTGLRFIKPSVYLIAILWPSFRNFQIENNVHPYPPKSGHAKWGQSAPYWLKVTWATPFLPDNSWLFITKHPIIWQNNQWSENFNSELEKTLKNSQLIFFVYFWPLITLSRFGGVGVYIRYKFQHFGLPVRCKFFLILTIRPIRYNFFGMLKSTNVQIRILISITLLIQGVSISAH